MANDTVDRRRFLVTSAGLVGVAAIAACKDDAGPVPAAAARSSLRVRVGSVPTAVEGNLLPALVAAFEQATRYRIDLVTTPELYGAARAGELDLAISHYGHRDAEQFVLDGLGEWPRMIFSNQMALVGPPSDPAVVRGLDDAAAAFARIAAAGSPFVVNELDGIRYLIEILWNASGRPDRTRWLRDHERGDALAEAARRGAYTLWGLTPFLRERRQQQLALEPMVLADPLLQRMLVSIVVKPRADAGLNVEGAHAFQRFLLEPATQARIREIRYSDDDPIVCWVPAGRHNRTAILPKG